MSVGAWGANVCVPIGSGIERFFTTGQEMSLEMVSGFEASLSVDFN